MAADAISAKMARLITVGTEEEAVDLDTDPFMELEEDKAVVDDD